MEYNQEEKDKLVKGLRGLADFVEKTEFDMEKAYWGSLKLYLWCSDGNSFLKNIKQMGGFKKEFSSYSAEAIKEFENVTFSLHCTREQVCEKVKVGVTVIPAKPETIIPAEPEKIVDKYEYKCPETLLGKEVEEVGANHIW